MLKLLFWALATLDAAVLLLFFVLGLAAAGPAKVSTAEVALVMLLLPGLALLAACVVYTRATALPARGLAFALVAAPVLLALGSQAVMNMRLAAHSNAQGELVFFQAGPQRDLAEAIQRNDGPAVTAALAQADVQARGLMGMTPLVLALRQLRSTPQAQAVLQALLAAGADPNQGTAYEHPLQMALQIGTRTGPGPVQMLLAAGARPNQPDSSGRPIYFGAAGLGGSVEQLVLMLRHGADLRATGTGGETVLVYAATARSWRALHHLLAHGADVNQGRSAQGLTVRELVASAAQERQHRGAQPQDEGLQDVLDYLKSH